MQSVAYPSPKINPPARATRDAVQLRAVVTGAPREPAAGQGRERARGTVGVRVLRGCRGPARRVEPAAAVGRALGVQRVRGGVGGAAESVILFKGLGVIFVRWSLCCWSCRVKCCRGSRFCSHRYVKILQKYIASKHAVFSI